MFLNTFNNSPYFEAPTELQRISIIAIMKTYNISLSEDYSIYYDINKDAVCLKNNGILYEVSPDIIEHYMKENNIIYP